VAELRRLGREEDARGLAEAWVREAPEALQAHVTWLTTVPAARPPEGLERRVEALLFLLGESGPRLALLSDALTTMDQPELAARLADRWVGPPGLDRIEGLLRSGTLPLVRGRFNDATRMLEQAVEEGVAQPGSQYLLFCALESLAGLARVLHDPAGAAARYS